jgi:acyl carrier protein
MTISSRTPEGEPRRCAICGGLVATEPSQPLGDSVCPRCGALLVQFRDTLAVKLGVEEDKLLADVSFTRDLGMDSLDTVELVMELEEEFDVNIPDDEAEKIQTVGDAIRWVLRHQRDFGDRGEGGNRQ